MGGSGSGLGLRPEGSGSGLMAEGADRCRARSLVPSQEWWDLRPAPRGMQSERRLGRDTRRERSPERGPESERERERVCVIERSVCVCLRECVCVSGGWRPMSRMQSAASVQNWVVGSATGAVHTAPRGIESERWLGRARRPGCEPLCIQAEGGGRTNVAHAVLPSVKSCGTVHTAPRGIQSSGGRRPMSRMQSAASVQNWVVGSATASCCIIARCP